MNKIIRVCTSALIYLSLFGFEYLKSVPRLANSILPSLQEVPINNPVYLMLGASLARPPKELGSRLLNLLSRLVIQWICMVSLLIQVIKNGMKSSYTYFVIDVYILAFVYVL